MKNSKAKELTPEQFRKMQLTELDMLVEFDRVCRKHNINYVLFGGSLLGAVRHQGYIPWDDDADIGMLREDYNRFKNYIGELNSEICYFQDHDTDPEYRWGYGKIRRTGSEYVRVGQEHLKCKTGIFVDVFPMDDIPMNLPGQLIQNFRCFVLRKILWSEVGRVNTKARLCRLGVISQQDTLCVLCNRGDENYYHLFLGCSFTWQVWCAWLSYVGMQWTCPGTMKEHF